MKKSLRFSSIALGIAAATMATVSLAACKVPCNYKCEPCAAPCAPCAAPCAPSCCESLLTGWYVGGQAAYDSYRVRDTFNAPAVIADEAFTTTNVRNAVGIAGGLFAGYGMQFDGPWYLGAELWANASNAGASTHSITFTDADSLSSDIQGNWSWGVSVLPGYKVNCGTLLYSRLGYARHRLKTTASFTDADLGRTFSHNNSDWFSGFEYGIGLETVVAGPWSVRGEFDHTFLGSNTHNFTTYSASDNQFSLGLVYHFC